MAFSSVLTLMVFTLCLLQGTESSREHIICPCLSNKKLTMVTRAVRVNKVTPRPREVKEIKAALNASLGLAEKMFDELKKIPSPNNLLFETCLNFNKSPLDEMMETESSILNQSVLQSDFDRLRSISEYISFLDSMPELKKNPKNRRVKKNLKKLKSGVKKNIKTVKSNVPKLFKKVNRGVWKNSKKMYDNVWKAMCHMESLSYYQIGDFQCNPVRKAELEDASKSESEKIEMACLIVRDLQRVMKDIEKKLTQI